VLLQLANTAPEKPELDHRIAVPMAPTNAVLNILWTNLNSAHVHFMRNLMIELGLLVPLNEDISLSLLRASASLY
jgi:hypothetical protein